MSSVPSQPFLRNRLTWLAYLMLAYIAVNQTILGPLMPTLRREMNLNYTLGGMLPAASALGLVFSGLIGDWLARHFKRQSLFWGGSVGLVSSVVLLSLSHNFELTIIAALAMGFGSSLTQVMIQALLSDEHGEQRAIAFTEANVAASLSATVTPVLIGTIQGLHWNWRLIPILPLCLLILLVTFYYRVPVPDNAPLHTGPEAASVNLPFTFWMYWLVLFLVVAVEMAIAVWATDFLANIAGLGTTNAALAFGAFPAAMLLGRFLGSRLTQQWSSHILLPLAIIITMIGFPIFWLARSATFNVIGLFITGLGIANLYPLTLSIAVGMAAQQSNQASARASLAVGTALLAIPLFLGWLSDRLGIQNAYGIVIVLAVLALAIVINNRLLLKRTVIPQP
jgi:predicted MFS family arabinose efflux permease